MRIVHPPPSRLDAHPERPGTAPGAPESPRYFDFADGQIYTVTHSPACARRGAVLLCGPFGVERERAYLTLVRWSRMLAGQGFEVMRFDYRGQGESTGQFEDMTIARWREDAAFCAARLSGAGRGDPLILHGVRLGALIAAELFASGYGDGLLLWEAPVSAEALLRDTLRHNLIAQRLAHPDAPHRVREQLIAALESGEHVNVDGYSWSFSLWEDAARHPLILPPPSESRPWHSLQTRSAAAPRRTQSSRPETVDADTFWSSSSPHLVPRSEDFFRASLRWIDEQRPWRAERS